MKNHLTIYDEMLEEVDRINKQYSDIEHITASVEPTEDGLYRVAVYCESEELYSTLVHTVEACSCVLTYGVAMGLGIIDENGHIITDEHYGEPE